MTQDFDKLVNTELNKRVVAAQERERSRFARLLHAEPLQLLNHVISTFNGAIQSGEALTERETMTLEMCSLAQHHLSFLCHEEQVDGIEQVGLAVVLCDLQRVATDYLKQNVSLVMPDELCGRRFDVDLETALYRIAQNAVFNSAKHAEASSINISLTEKNGILHLVIEDNGRGFDASKVSIAKLVERNHHGLSDMTSYAAAFCGQLLIKSQIGAGTRIEAHVPVKAYQPRRSHFDRPEVKKIIRRAERQARGLAKAG
jgi:signal transduction histidine kinase